MTGGTKHPPQFHPKEKQMAKAKQVLDVKGPPVEPKTEPKKEKPKGEQVQVHRGNIDILTLQFKEQEVIMLSKIAGALIRIANKLEQPLG